MQSADCQRCQGTPSLRPQGLCGLDEGPGQGCHPHTASAPPRFCPAAAAAPATPRPGHHLTPASLDTQGGARDHGEMEPSRLRCSGGRRLPGCLPWHTAALQIKGHCELTSLFQTGAGSTFLRLPLIRRGKPIFRQETKQEQTHSRGLQCPPSPAAAPCRKKQGSDVALTLQVQLTGDAGCKQKVGSISSAPSQVLLTENSARKALGKAG